MHSRQDVFPECLAAGPRRSCNSRVVMMQISARTKSLATSLAGPVWAQMPGVFQEQTSQAEQPLKPRESARMVSMVTDRKAVERAASSAGPRESESSITSMRIAVVTSRCREKYERITGNGIQDG